MMLLSLLLGLQIWVRTELQPHHARLFQQAHNICAFSAGRGDNQNLFLELRRNSAGTTLRLAAGTTGHDGYVHSIIGIKNPGSTSTTPTSTTTTDTDEIFRLAATSPSAPSGGRSSVLNTPTGWSRAQPAQHPRRMSTELRERETTRMVSSNLPRPGGA